MKKRFYGKSAFSLIEVNMAILVAAGGLLSIISYFPLGLRQGVMAKADMSESMFANSFFETISENVKRIENVAEWNNIDRFWQAAVEGTGIERNLKTIQAAKSSNMSEATKQLFYKFNGPSGANSPIRYVWREEPKPSPESSPMILPPQFLIRIVKIKNTNDNFPVRYGVTLVSSDQPPPAIYHENAIYHAEFYFNRRP